MVLFSLLVHIFAVYNFLRHVPKKFQAIPFIY
jgi:hypothetical protein